jgi:hypothetical protein
MTGIDGTDGEKAVQAAPTLVERDIVAGLADVFSPLEGFRAPHQFANVAPISNGTQTAVVWEYSVTHTGDFQGIRPTGREIVVRGVTIVDTSGDEPVYHRYIDWADVFAQLSLSTTGRPALDDPFASLG